MILKIISVGLIPPVSWPPSGGHDQDQHKGERYVSEQYRVPVLTHELPCSFVVDFRAALV